MNNKKEKLNQSSEKLHSRLLTMAKAFHTICEEHSLNYYMLGGTMLGAVRHQGFIPWDDDMDFGMPREDYNTFINNAEKILPSNYELRYYKNTENSPMHYAKFIDNTTTLIENGYRDYVEGLYIDVFPLDGAGNGGILDRLRMNRISFLQGLIIYHCTTRVKSGVRGLVQKYAQFRDLDGLHDAIERAMTAKSISDSFLIANYLGAWGAKEIMPKDIMGIPRLYKFEDTELYGVHNADEYLKSLYGNYMQFPPKDKQVFRHNYYYLNYDLPFREFDFENLNL